MFIMVGIYVILAISLNLAMGYTRLLNLGHAAFYGIGAYTSALLALNFGMPFWFSMLIGGLFAAFFGLILAYPSSKLKGDYLALATLGFVLIVENVLRNWTDVTRGSLGIPGIPRPELFGFTFNGLMPYFVLVLGLAFITYLVIKRIVDAPFGRVLKAIRDDEVAAASLGKNVVKYKTIVLIISSFFAGVAGGLLAHYISYIDPSTFTVMESIYIISMIVIGGLASMRGAVIGALLIGIIPEIVRFMPISPGAVGPLRIMIYSVILIIVILNRPNGILGEASINSSMIKEAANA
jgi:branched-chain amino acid transport system permease protein